MYKRQDLEETNLPVTLAVASLRVMVISFSWPFFHEIEGNKEKLSPIITAHNGDNEDFSKTCVQTA